MPHFSGCGNTQGYNVTDHESGEVVAVSDNTIENVSKEVENWKTKRERGAEYGMNPRNEWNKQMDFLKTTLREKQWLKLKNGSLNTLLM